MFWCTEGDEVRAGIGDPRSHEISKSTDSLTRSKASLIQTDTRISPAQSGRNRAIALTGKQSGRLNWPVLFLVTYIGFQLGLLFLAATPLRLPLRIGAYSISLALLICLRPGRLRHPGAAFIAPIILCCIPGLFINGRSDILAAVAQVVLYLATLAPLLWVSSQSVSPRKFRVVVLLLWGFNVASASVGVLQTYNPGKYQGQLSSVLEERGTSYLGSMTVLLANGTRVFRPMGLTDQPGGAAAAGLYSILLGVGLVFTERAWWSRILAVGGMVVGLFVIYISHVRVSLIMSAVSLVVVAATFLRRGDVKRLSLLLVIAVTTVAVGTFWAFAVGGDETIKRFGSLTETAPTDVYSQNRGLFLDDLFSTVIYDYPFGAGAGRWGMINIYFGDPAHSLWAEIMWTAWVYDGGIPLLLVYSALLGVGMWTAWRIGTGKANRQLAVWGGVVLAYNIAAVSACFDAPVFGTQSALELWFLNACLFAAARPTAKPDNRGDLERSPERLARPVPA